MTKRTFEAMKEVDETTLAALDSMIPTSPTAILIHERGHTHGDYVNTARYIQQLKNIAYRAYNERSQRGQPALTPQQKESLEMILHKAGRILSGDPSFQDHWDDIGGYAHIANKEF